MQTALVPLVPSLPQSVQLDTAFYDGRLAQAFGVPVSADQRAPWSAELVESFYAGRDFFTHQGKRGKNAAAKEWEKVVEDKCGAEDYPENVVYPVTCHGTCVCDPMAERCFATVLHARLNSLIAVKVQALRRDPKAKVPNVVGCDLLLCGEGVGHWGSVVSYVRIAEAWASHGRIEASFYAAHILPSDGSPPSSPTCGSIFGLTYKPFAIPAKPWGKPLCEANVGMMDMITGRSFAASFSKCTRVAVTP